MELGEVVKKCIELLNKYPKLSIEEIVELRCVTSIIQVECDNAAWEHSKYHK